MSKSEYPVRIPNPQVSPIGCNAAPSNCCNLWVVPYTGTGQGEESGLLSGGSPALKRERGRGDIGGAMAWPAPHGSIFRELLMEPRAISALLEVFEDGFRLGARSLQALTSTGQGVG